MYEHNILIYHPNEETMNAYRAKMQGFGFKQVNGACGEEEARVYVGKTEIILGWKFPSQLLNETFAPKLRWFQSMGAGVDDLVQTKEFPRNVTLTRIVDKFGAYISEYVFTYLLYIVKDVSRISKAQRERSWEPFIAETLSGKTIGVAGLGSIGSEIVRKARAFDMKVNGLSFTGKASHLVDNHYNPEQWKDFVKELDYLVLTLPLTDKTAHIVNKDILLAMKKDACIINVGRGALIQEEDLLSVLQSGHLRAAVLDVFEKEPLREDHPFWALPNVYVTPHLSGPSTVDNVCNFFHENIKRYRNEQPLLGAVDLQVKY